MKPEIPPTIYGALHLYILEGCDDLPARISQDTPASEPVLTSAWRPSEAELLELVSGGCIIVQQRGTLVNAIAMFVEGVAPEGEDG